MNWRHWISFMGMFIFIFATVTFVQPTQATTYDIPIGDCFIQGVNGDWQRVKPAGTLWHCGAYAAYFAEKWGVSRVSAVLNSTNNHPDYLFTGYNTREYMQAIKSGSAPVWGFGGIVCGIDDHKPYQCQTNLVAEFFAGNDCTGRNLGSFDTYYNNIIPRGTIKNDEARSMKIYGARVGTVFEIFDNPEGKKNDDWTRIRLQRSLADYCVGSFQYYSFDDADVQYDLYWKNGLDGKVSRIHIFGR